MPDFAENPQSGSEAVPPVEKIRCHPVMVVEFTLQGLIFGIIVAYVAGAFLADYPEIPGIYVSDALLVLFLASFIWIGYWRWKKTTVTFTENEMTVVRDTVFKLNKRIPYSKIASVNANRGILNRITGTTKLLFNVNSAVNAALPEVSLIFGKETADRIRSDLSGKMYDNNMVPENEKSIPSIVDVTAKDIVFHSFLSQPTAVSIYGLIFFVIGLLQIIFQGATAGFTATVMLFVPGYVFPVITTIFYYYGYKIYRIGDTIYISHGLIREYKTSFKINKINAVVVFSPLFPRMIKMKMIRAEVLGLGSSEEKGQTPLLCPLKDSLTVEKILNALVPELNEKFETDLQPPEAAKPILTNALLWSIVTAAVIFIVFAAVSRSYDVGVYGILFPIAAALAVIAYFAYGIRSTKVLKYGLGTDVFTMVTGVIDRAEMTMYYDKVQIASVKNGPVSRIWNVSRCEVSLLSASGEKKTKSGYFRTEDLEKIPDIVVDRIVEGRYDYRKYL